MDDNNNIEDFFNNSMEHFNDAPPDSVWNGINNRLDQSPVWWKQPKIWASGLFLFLLIGSIIGYSIHMNQRVHQLENEVGLLNHIKDSLEFANLEVQSHLVDCGFKSDKLVSIINAYSAVEKPMERTPKKAAMPKPDLGTTTVESTTNAIIGIPQQGRTQRMAPPITPSPVVEEEIIPDELNEQIDSIITNQSEMIEKGEQLIKVPIHALDKDSSDQKYIEVEGMKPDIKKSIKEQFKDIKERLEFKKWKLRKRKDRNRDE